MSFNPEDIPLLSREFSSVHEPLFKEKLCMSISEIDGLLTSVAIGPELIAPEEWMPLIFYGKEPQFSSQETSAQFMEAIVAHFNRILGMLKHSPEAHGPIIHMEAEDKPEFSSWALGFILGVNLRFEKWGELFDPKATAMCSEQEKEVAVTFYRILQSQLHNRTTGDYTYGEELYKQIRSDLSKLENPFTSEIVLCESYWAEHGSDAKEQEKNS